MVPNIRRLNKILWGVYAVREEEGTVDESSRTWYFRDMGEGEVQYRYYEKLLMEWGIQFWGQLEKFEVDASELSAAEKLSKSVLRISKFVDY